MKKFLAIIAIASFAVACNGSGDKTSTTDTTSAPAVDTTTAPAVDTTKAPVVDTTKAPAVDTTKAKM
jgi:hypothetical protein